MNRRRLTFVAAVAWLGLSACAVFDAGRGLQIGVSQGPDIVARQGQPSGLLRFNVHFNDGVVHRTSHSLLTRGRPSLMGR